MRISIFNKNNSFKEKLKNRINCLKSKFQKKKKSRLDLKKTIVKKPKQPFFSKKRNIVLVVIAILFVITLSATSVIGYYSYKIAMQLKNQALEARFIANETYQAFKNNDLPLTQQNIEKIQIKLNNIKSLYTKLFFYSKLPIAKEYYQDGNHALNSAQYGLDGAKLAVDTLVPYADVLGFKGEDSYTGGTAENRIQTILATVDKVMPAYDEIVNNLQKANQELSFINAQRYGDYSTQINQAQNLLDQGIEFMTEFKPALVELPNILGADERKKYLILFQNDNELRPTGGFLTAYSVVWIENGKVTPEKSDDIYRLDEKFNQRVPIPEKLGKYLYTEKYWNLRDMNINPDYKQSIETFLQYYTTIRGASDDLDGVIAVDTYVLTELLKVTGPVDVPGYGTFTAEKIEECDCPQVVYALSEIITKPTPYIREDRKGVLGPLMQVILHKTYGIPKQKFANLFQIAQKSLEGRHVQMYFLDENAQKAAEAINAAGRLQPVKDKDYLAIVNANLGGAKSNLFIDYKVIQKIQAPENGKLHKTVEITYQNHGEADNCNLEAGLLCLNAVSNDWTRLYVPQGSELISANGFKEDVEVYEENGFTVFDGEFQIAPKSSAKLVVEYTIPYENNTDYEIKLWKQGGIDQYQAIMDVQGYQEEIVVNKDTIYKIDFE